MLKLEKAAYLTAAPLPVPDLVELEVLGVGSEEAETPGWGGLLEVDLRVDVEREVCSAWRPDHGFDLEFVGNLVVPSSWTPELRGQSSRGLLAREIIGGALCTGDTLFDVFKAAIVDRE
jgi:hypothetical protein